MLHLSAHWLPRAFRAPAESWYDTQPAPFRSACRLSWWRRCVPAADRKPAALIICALAALVSLPGVAVATSPAGLSTGALFQAGDQPPVITNSGTSQTFVEDGEAVVVDAGLTVTDVDGGTIGGATVQITENFVSGEDVLDYTTTNGITGSYDAATGILTLKGDATAAAYQAALASVKYRDTSQRPGTAPRTISFALSQNSAYLPATGPATGHFYEYVPASVPWTDAQARAEDQAKYGTDGWPKGVYGLQGYLVTVTSQAEQWVVQNRLPDEGEAWMGANDLNAEGVWRWVTGPEGLANDGLGQYFSAQHKTGACAASTGTAVDGSYVNWSYGEPNDCNGTGSGLDGEDYGQFTANGKWNDKYDNAGTVTGYVVEYGGMAGDPTLQIASSTTVNIQATNDPPFNIVPGAQWSVSGSALTFSTARGNVLAVSDPDAGAGLLTASLVVGHGRLTLAGSAGLSALSGDGSAAVSITGPLAALNAALNGLRYTSAAGYVGPDSLTVTTDDLGNTGAGTALVDSDAVAITVRAVPGTVYVDDDYTPATTDWGYDHFAAIAGGLQIVADGGTVYLADGHYMESLTLDRDATVTASGSIDLSGGVMLSAGTFNAPAGTLTLGGGFTHNGGTFNANGGTVVLAGSPVPPVGGPAVTTFANLEVNSPGVSTGLLAYWTFDETSGSSFNDSSGHGITLVTSASHISDAPAAIAFDDPAQVHFFDWTEAQADGIDLANRSFSVSFWAKRDQTGRGDYIISQDLNWPETLNIGFRSNDRFTCSFNVFNFLDTQAYADTDWHHWACTYDASTKARRLYRDGALVAQDTAPADYAGTGTTYVGYSPTFGTFYHGALDDLRIYDGALTPAAVATLARGSSGAPGTITLAAPLDIDGNLTLRGGSLDAGAGQTLSLAGDWLAAGGTFLPRSGTVTLDGGDQAISGDNAFYNLSKTTAGAATLTFTAATTQTVQGSLTLLGAEANRLALHSSLPGTRWRIDPQGARTVGYLDVQDSHNTNATLINALSTHSLDRDNNTGWEFAAPLAGFGRALDLDGVDDYVDLGAGGPVLGASFTEEAWIYPGSGGAQFGPLIGSPQDNDAQPPSLDTVDGLKLRFGFGTGAAGSWTACSGTTPTSVLAPDTWNHVAAAYDGDAKTYRIFVNGVEVYTLALSSCPGSPNAVPVRYSGRGDGYYKGSLDDVRLWDTALPGETIAAWANRTITAEHPNYATLAAYYAFDEEAGDTSYPTVGSANATLYNGTARTASATPRYRLAEGASASVYLFGSDADGDPLAFSVASQPVHGSLDCSGSTCTYTHDGSESPADSIRFLANDGTVDSDGTAVAAFDITPVNDAPSISVPAAQSVPEDAALILGGAEAITIADPDAGSNPVRVVLTATHGTVSLAGTGGLTFIDGDGAAYSALAFSGTIQDVNAALDGLCFQPDSGYWGPAALEIGVDDLGNSGVGGALSDQDTIAITVDQVAPSGFSAAAPPDGAYGQPYAVYAFVATGAAPPPTYLVSSGTLPPGLTLGSDGRLTGTPTAAGIYAGLVVRASNPGGTYDSPPFTIKVDKAPLMVTAEDKTIFYGETLPTFTAGYSGFVAGDTAATALSGQPAFATGATAGSPAGSYPITVTAGSLAAANYALSFANGTLTIAERPISELRIYLPILACQSEPPLPDLVIERIEASAAGLAVVIRNQGQAAVTNEFWVDAYLAPNSVPTQVDQVWAELGSQGLAWGVTASALPLAPGESLTLTLGSPYYVPELSQVRWPLAAGTPVYVQVDSLGDGTSFGAVLETHEQAGGTYNNISGPVLATDAGGFANTAPASSTGEGREGLPRRAVRR